MLSRESALELATSSANSKGLAIVVLPFSGGEEGDVQTRFAMGHMVYSRAGGFLLIFPAEEELRDVLLALEPPEGSDAPAIFACEVDMETPRGRPLGTAQGYLVDIPNELIGKFCSAPTARGRGLGPTNTIQFIVDDAMARPVKASAFTKADGWIAGEMDHDTAQDYLTGEEYPELEEVQPGSTVDVQALQQRIQELEGLVQHQQSVPVRDVPNGPSGVARSKAPPLFQQNPSQGLSAADWERLQRLAGSPPPRVASAEQRRGPLEGAVTEQENLFAHLDREAEDEQQVDLAIAAAQTGDPMQQMMLAQLRQNQILLSRLVSPKFQDPVLGALAGGGDGSSSNSSGVKGMLARDVFIKAIQDLSKVAAIGQQNALQELGFDDSRLDSSLMRRYVERRMPLAENRQLAYLAFMLAEAWAVAYNSSNKELQGSVCKMLIFIEQTVLDGGKMGLSWLLTGQQDPPFHLLVSSRRKPGLQPFTRLASPSWVSANLAYVKDLDVLESKMLTMNKADKTKVLTEDAEEDFPKKPGPKKRPTKQKGGGKGDAGQSSNESTTA